MKYLTSYHTNERGQRMCNKYTVFFLTNMQQLNWAFYIFSHSWRHLQKLKGKKRSQLSQSRVQKPVKASMERRRGKQQTFIKLCLNYFFEFAVVIKYYKLE